ncbi:MAG: glucosaminidase domain-containing protein [Rhodothalassiaceae bacterium]
MIEAVFTILLALGLTLPVPLGVWQVNRAHERAYFAERIAYERHLPPPADATALIDTLGYHPAQARSGAPVPRRFLAALPDDLDRVQDVAARKRLFFASILPLVLRVNELIAEDRKRLLALETKVRSGQRLDDWERHWLGALAKRYGLRRGRAPEDIDFARLKRRVDIVPPSIALAQAAIESGWGQSRFALYGQWTWNASHDGIVPERREEGKRHRIRAFDFLIDSVGAYMNNLNRAPAYRAFRQLRAALRAEGRPLHGSPLVPALRAYSERGEAYVAELQAIIAANELEDFDDARLAPPTAPLPVEVLAGAS